MLAAKKDSPIRLLPIARYVTMKESTLPDREIPDDEKECISQSEAEENAEKSVSKEGEEQFHNLPHKMMSQICM